MHEVEGRRSEAKGGEDHPGRNDPVLWWVDHGDAEEYGLNHMGENDDDEDEDDNDEGNAIAPPAPMPATMLEEIIKEEAPVENGRQEVDDLDDLDDDPNECYSDMDEWFPEDGSNDRDWVIESKSLSLGLRIIF
jgi:hypothetical protein